MVGVFVIVCVGVIVFVGVTEGVIVVVFVGVCVGVGVGPNTITPIENAQLIV